MRSLVLEPSEEGRNFDHPANGSRRGRNPLVGDSIRRRRLLLATLAVGGVGAAAAALGVITFLSPRHEPAQPQITSELSVFLGKEKSEIALKAAQEWDDKYGFGKKIELRPLREKAGEINNGIAQITVESADSGYIEISNVPYVRDVTLHGMTHAYVPETPTILEKPLRVDSYEVVGYRGLRLNMLLNGERRYFTLFEEGIAEQSAASFPGYISRNPAYRQLGSLSSRAFSQDRYPNAYTWPQQNNVPEFLRAFHNLSPNAEIDSLVLKETMNIYQAAWNRGLPK